MGFLSALLGVSKVETPPSKERTAEAVTPEEASLRLRNTAQHLSPRSPGGIFLCMIDPAAGHPRGGGLVRRTISSALLLAVNITLILAYDSQKCLLIKLSKKTLFKILSD